MIRERYGRMDLRGTERSFPQSKFIDPQTDDPKVVEVFLMKYSFTDQFGNDAQPVERKVIVRDTTGPFMELIGPKEVEIPLGGVFEDPGANWFDLLNGQGVVFSDNECKRKGTRCL